MTRKMISLRLPPTTHGRLETLKKMMGLTKTAIIRIAIDRMYWQEVARRERQMKKYQPSDRLRAEEHCAELFLVSATAEDIDAMHIDELTVQISGLIESEDDAPLNHFGDPMTPADVAEYLKNWAARQIETDNA